MILYLILDTYFLIKPNNHPVTENRHTRGDAHLCKEYPSIEYEFYLLVCFSPVCFIGANKQTELKKKALNKPFFVSYVGFFFTYVYIII